MAEMAEMTATGTGPQTGEPLLEVHNLTKSFGGLTAVGDLELVVNRGEIVSIIGPNGAGKTTVFNLITGLYQPNHTLDGQRNRFGATLALAGRRVGALLRE